jgi:NADH-quinone oxidoreductase subunit G
VLGPVPSTGQDEVFRNAANGKQTFVIQAEKVPNAAGIRRVITQLGGPSATFDELLAGQRPELSHLKAGWIVGGYLTAFPGGPLPPALASGFKAVQDLLSCELAESADVFLPATAWAEKDGSWENCQGRLQAFAAAVRPPELVLRDGDVYLRLLGRSGMYNAPQIRAEMGEPWSQVQMQSDHHAAPPMEFVEL